MIQRINLEKVYQYLMVALAFLMPLTVAGANTIIVLICFLWLFSGNYLAKFKKIISSKLLIASIVFYSIHVIGLLWTEDIKWGLHILHKMWYFILLLPILYSIVREEFIDKYIGAFLLAISITEVFSYLVWFELISPFKNATVNNPTPFMSHISYNPILAIAIYLVLHEIFFNKKLNKLRLYSYSFFSISMSINMFITGGRAGQVMFFAMLGVLLFQYFNKQFFKGLIVFSLATSTIFLSAYQFSTIFQDRVNYAISDIKNFDSNKNTSVGQRITFAINSWEVVLQNPLFGVGTGDFPAEYKKVNKLNSPSLPDTTNPHNMYLLILVQLGLIGLISFLIIFFYQIKLSFISKTKLIKDFGLTLPLLFLLIMLSDSYLLGHYTTLIYIFFSSFLYKNFERD